MIEIPQKIYEANGIETNHEENEYYVNHPCGMFLNIPSDSKIEIFGDGWISIRIGSCAILTLYITAKPHITFL